MTLRSIVPLLLALATVVLIGAMHGPRGHVSSVLDNDLPLPKVQITNGNAILSASDGQTIVYTLDGTTPLASSKKYDASEKMTCSRQLWSIPTSPQWKHPVGITPQAITIRARVLVGERLGPVVTRTVITHPHALPVVSVVAPPGAFFDPDTGLYVAGNMIFQNDPNNTIRFARDGSWWKYPGNYQGRGKTWQRLANMEYYSDEGLLLNQAIDVRINGQNTRGFPIRSLRVKFHETARGKFFEDSVAAFTGMIIRTAGNDYNRALMRDALQHELCANMPFATSASRPVILYLSGTYWGIHHLRQRLDENELERRYGLNSKKITILEDRAKLYRGNRDASGEFRKMIWRAVQAAKHHPDEVRSAVEQELDLESFLKYMAAQVILCNTDWPDQNLKYWRWEGKHDKAQPMTDGRWRMIMGDSDMGMGYIGGGNAGEYDMISHLRSKKGPIAQLFNALMASNELREEFIGICEEQLNGPLQSVRMMELIDAYASKLAPEVELHTMRWRRPSSPEHWLRAVESLRRFAKDRPAAVRRQLKALESMYAPL